ncbi:hypothetical protein J3Q64DRAFT_1815666 [Phycomyces blakesleeanus]|uniref:Uncharacterized protein n=1 Tax=Phycomyces blakesleeanus TaxID=4837 RepID=A0ABR3APP9_PHYBL
MPPLHREPRKIIAVSLDQTLAHTLEALISWHNQVHQTHLHLSDFDTTDYSKVWGGSHQERDAKMREFYESDNFKRIRPIDDFALETLKTLKRRRFSLVIITSRQQCVAELTKKFVDRHYPGLFESIYFCNFGMSDTADQLDYVSKPKSAICQEIGADVLIDHRLDHALDCAALGIDVLLYDRRGQYKWSHVDRARPRPKATLTSTSRRLYQRTPPRVLPSNVKRIKSWKEVISHFPKPRSPLRFCHFPIPQDDYCINSNSNPTSTPTPTPWKDSLVWV